jgi:hypothetical protein
MSKLIGKKSTEQVAGNGLLHRRALLGRGLTLAGVVGASGVPTGAAAEPLMDAPWSLEPGNPVPAYQLTPPKTLVQEVAASAPGVRVFVVHSDERQAFERAQRIEAMERVRARLVKLERRAQ